MKLLNLIFGVLALTRAEVPATAKTFSTLAPLRIRAYLPALRRAFNSRDQEVFKMFTDAPFNATAGSPFTNLSISLSPKTGDVSDFDFNLNLEAENLGASSENVQFSGKGLFNGDEFTFSGPIDQVAIRYAQGTKRQADFNYEAIVFTQQEWILNVGDVATAGAAGAAGASAQLKEDIIFGLNEYKEALLEARQDLVKQFPIDLVVPYVFFLYASQVSSRVQVDENHVTMEFSLEQFNFLKKNQLKLLKQIEGTFGPETNAEGDQAIVQIYIDDNFFNSFASVITTIDQMFSLREYFGAVPQAAQVFNFFETGAFGQILPDILEEYGAGRKLDIVMSPSHDLFIDGIPDAKPTGVYVDKSGNWKAVVNIPVQINVEKQGARGQWEPIRFIYATGLLKGKLTVFEKGENPKYSGKTFLAQPKTVSISQLVIKDARGEELELEQMLVQSMVNLQLDTFKKMFKNMNFELENGLNKIPQEVQCFGIKISDVGITFAKSVTQTSIYHKQVESPAGDICKEFYEAILFHQSEMIGQMQDGDSQMS
jgi:hypothetical protein